MILNTQEKLEHYRKEAAIKRQKKVAIKGQESSIFSFLKALIQNPKRISQVIIQESF